MIFFHQCSPEEIEKNILAHAYLFRAGLPMIALETLLQMIRESQRALPPQSFVHWPGLLDEPISADDMERVFSESVRLFAQAVIDRFQ